MRLLIIEDNPKLSALLVKLLSDRGYAVDAAADVAEATEVLRTVEYDLIVLDLTLPDGDGRAILQALRRRGASVPVLVATARSELVQRVDTLDDGADDYLVKPFSPEELLARVRALLRRPRQALDTVLSAGNVTLDTARMAVRVGEEGLDMPRREVSVLAILLREQGRLVARRTLEDAVYSLADEVTPNALEAAISRVRRRLEQAGATVTLTTMRGLGYILAERP